MTEASFRKSSLYRPRRGILRGIESRTEPVRVGSQPLQYACLLCSVNLFRSKNCVDTNGLVEAGRTVKITDSMGADMHMAYDDQGRLTQWVSKNPGEVLILYAPNSITLKTSWDFLQKNAYDPASGLLQSIEVHKDRQKAVMHFEQGRVTRFRQFDGGEHQLVIERRRRAHRITRTFLSMEECVPPLRRADARFTERILQPGRNVIF